MATYLASAKGALARVGSPCATKSEITSRSLEGPPVQRNVWAFDLGQAGSLSNKRLLKKFEDHGFDGMRCDVDGNLYITRYGKGTVAVVSPAGKLLREIDVLGKSPSNLCFGGPDGRTVYVTEVEHRGLVQFRVDRPGLAWQRWQDSRK